MSSSSSSSLFSDVFGDSSSSSLSNIGDTGLVEDDYLYNSHKRWFVRNGGDLEALHDSKLFTPNFILIVFGLFAFVINSMLFAALWRNREANNKTYAGRTTTQLILQQVFCDLFSATSIFFSIPTMSLGYMLGPVFCFFQGMLSSTPALVSMYNLALIGVVRYRLIVKEKRTTQKQIILSYAGLWCFAIIIELLLHTLNKPLLMKNMIACTPLTSGGVGALMSLSLGISIIMVVFTYYKMYRHVANTLIVQTEESLLMRKRVNRMMSIVVVIIISAWVPTAAVYAATAGAPGVVLFSILAALFFGASILNPFVYTYYSKEAKDSMRKLLGSYAPKFLLEEVKEPRTSTRVTKLYKYKSGDKGAKSPIQPEQKILSPQISTGGSKSTVNATVNSNSIEPVVSAPSVILPNVPEDDVTKVPVMQEEEETATVTDVVSTDLAVTEPEV